MLQNLAFPCPFLKNGFQNQNRGLFKIGRNNAIFGNQKLRKVEFLNFQLLSGHSE